MKLSNAIKKLEKLGYTITSEHQCYTAIIGRRVISFSRNGSNDEVFGFNVSSVNDRSNTMTDYYAGTWCDNLSQAILLAN